MLIALTVVPPVRYFVIAAAIVAVVEMLRPAQRGAGLRGRAENVAVFALNVVAFGLVVDQWPGVFSRLGRWGLLDVAVPARFHNTVAGIVATTLVYALVWDFFQYWAHRAQHQWRVLWPMHSVHHSDRCMNATTSGRQSIGSTLFGYAAIHVPTVVVVGPTLLTVVGATVLFSGVGYVNHANVRLPLGRATRWVSGPQLHRMHHGAGERYHDSNYAAFFPFLDRMFKTFLSPERDEWPDTGVVGDVRPLSVSVFWPWSRPADRGNRYAQPLGPGLTHLGETPRRGISLGIDGNPVALRSRQVDESTPGDSDCSIEFGRPEVGPGLFREINRRSG